MEKNFGEDWVHIDGSKFELENNSVDLIYASRVFEYFDRDEAKDVLKEWKRVLK